MAALALPDWLNGLLGGGAVPNGAPVDPSQLDPALLAQWGLGPNAPAANDASASANGGPTQGKTVPVVAPPPARDYLGGPPGSTPPLVGADGKIAPGFTVNAPVYQGVNANDPSTWQTQNGVPINPKTGLAKPNPLAVMQDVFGGGMNWGDAIRTERVRPLQEAMAAKDLAFKAQLQPIQQQGEMYSAKMIPQLLGQAMGDGDGSRGGQVAPGGATGAPAPAAGTGAAASTQTPQPITLTAPTAVAMRLPPQQRALYAMALMKGDLATAEGIIRPQAEADRESGYIIDKNTGNIMGRVPRSVMNKAGVFVDPYTQIGQPQPDDKGIVTYQDAQGVWHQGTAPGANAAQATRAYAVKGAESAAAAPYTMVTIHTPQGDRTMTQAQATQYLQGGGQNGAPTGGLNYDPAVAYGGGGSPASAPAAASGPGPVAGAQPWAHDPAAFIGGYVGGPVRVTSGYRSPQANAAVGGVANSAHLQPNGAYDFVPPQGVSPQQAAATLAQGLKRDGVPFDQVIAEPTVGPHSTGAHVHVSFAGSRGQVLGVQGFQGQPAQGAPQPQPQGNASAQPGPQGGGPGVLAPNPTQQSAGEDALKELRATVAQKQTVANLAQEFLQDSGNAATGPGYGVEVGGFNPGEELQNAKEGLGLKSDATALQKAESVTNRAFVMLRPAGSGRLLQTEVEAFKAAFPNIRNWPQTNSGIAQRLQGEAAQSAAELQFKEAWLQHGGTQEGANAAWLKQPQATPGYWFKGAQPQSGGAPAQAKPIVPRKAQGPAAPQPGQVVKGYRFNGGNPASPTSWTRVQ